MLKKRSVKTNKKVKLLPTQHLTFPQHYTHQSRHPRRSGRFILREIKFSSITIFSLHASFSLRLFVSHSRLSFAEVVIITPVSHLDEPSTRAPCLHRRRVNRQL